MGANTEMSRLDSIPTEKLNALMGLDTDTLAEIPAATSDENGKVLGVSDGQYALVSGGGGGGSVEPLIVNTTETGIDASYNDLETALLAGKNIYLYISGGYTPIMCMGDSGEEYFASFLNPNEFGLMYVFSSDKNSDMEGRSGG